MTPTEVCSSLPACDSIYFFGDPENNEKTRQNAENKQTFGLTRKLKLSGNICQNAENKQTFHLTGKN